MPVYLEETDSLVLREHRAHQVSVGQWDQLVSKDQEDCQDQQGLQEQ